MDLDAIADELYGLHPDAFVPARDDAVARAREAGDRDLAKAIARLRRPTRAAWLANLLARRRGEQLDGLLALSGDLADAQRTLDGNALRALSAQRRRLVGAMAREGARLAAQGGDTATDSVLRDLEGILDAALADPDVAVEVRSGRLTRTVSYSGFGVVEGTRGAPASTGGAGRGSGTAADPGRGGGGPGEGDRDGSDHGSEGCGRAGDGQRSGEPGQSEQEQADRERERAEQELRERERAERERIERLRAEREQALAEAEQAEASARDRADEAEAARADAEATHADARARVADLTAELETARERERRDAATAREATATAREAAREAGAATTRAERARARLAEITAPR
jgi:hypothetical protein